MFRTGTWQAGVWKQTTWKRFVWWEPVGGGTSPADKFRRRKQLREHLKKQYDREIEQLLNNLVIAPEPSEEMEPVKEKKAVQVHRPISITLPDIEQVKEEVQQAAKHEVEQALQYQKKRELLIRRIQRERAIRRLEEEMAAMLVLSHLVD